MSSSEIYNKNGKFIALVIWNFIFDLILVHVFMLLGFLYKLVVVLYIYIFICLVGVSFAFSFHNHKVFELTFLMSILPSINLQSFMPMCCS